MAVLGDAVFLLFFCGVQIVPSVFLSGFGLCVLLFSTVFVSLFRCHSTRKVLIVSGDCVWCFSAEFFLVFPYCFAVSAGVVLAVLL